MSAFYVVFILRHASPDCAGCALWVDSTVCFLAHDPCHHNTPPTRLTKRKASVFFCCKLPTAGDFKMCSAWASDGLNHAFVCSIETTRLTPLLHAESSLTFMVNKHSFGQYILLVGIE